MDLPAEITLALSRREPAVYAAQLRLRMPDQNESVEEGTVLLEPDKLMEGWRDGDQYGRALTAAVFTDPKLKAAWLRARERAGRGRDVRVRLELEEHALELHRVRWETLRDPESDLTPDPTAGRLLTDQRVWFSRYLHSFEMRPVHPRSRTAARALVAVASPTNLAGMGPLFQGKKPFRVEDELKAIAAAMKPWTENVITLPDGEGKQPTLKRITEHLRGGTGYDVLYLVAHGALHESGPKLLLVDDNGQGKMERAADLVDEMRRMRFPPRLVVLSSCQSAGTDDPGAAADPPPAAGPAQKPDRLDAALGPQLGKIGIPAVVAMFGDVLQPTARLFVETFFRRLKPGQVDQAAAEARQAVGGASDYWAPVLYTRLTNGRLWRDPAAERFEEWPALLQQLRNGRCVPVLGSGLLEPLVGSTRGIAERLPGAAAVLSSAGSADLPQVAQFVAAVQDEQALRGGYLDALADELREQFGALDGSADLGPGTPPQYEPPPSAEFPEEDPLRDKAWTVRHLLAAAADRVAADRPPEAHDVLARLNLPLYLSTNPDDLLARALARTPLPPLPAGPDTPEPKPRPRQPVVRVCNWLFPEDGPPGAPADDPTPTPDRPLVYHLFGHLSHPYSVVLSEDHYFKFLVGMSRTHGAKSAAQNEPRFQKVNARLAQSGLLFLGFRLDDWDFRAFLRFFMGPEAARSRRKWGFKDVAVQLDPDDGRNADPAQVRRYLARMFEHAHISIYWGSTQEFLEELERQW